MYFLNKLKNIIESPRKLVKHVSITALTSRSDRDFGGTAHKYIGWQIWITTDDKGCLARSPFIEHHVRKLDTVLTPTTFGRRTEPPLLLCIVSRPYGFTNYII